MTADYEEKAADLEEILDLEGIEIGWNPRITSKPKNADSFFAVQSDIATRFTFVSGGAVRGSDFFLVVAKSTFSDVVPKSGHIFEVPKDSGKTFRVGEVQTSETDPAYEFVMTATDTVSSQ